MLYAVRDMADQAKKNLAVATANMEKSFTEANAKEEKRSKANAADRAAIAADIEAEKKIAARELDDAAAFMEKTLLTLKTETRKKIKKTNKKVNAYGAVLKKEAKDVKAQMASNMKTLTQKIANAEDSAKRKISAANAKSMAGFKDALKTVREELGAAEAKSNKKFS